MRPLTSLSLFIIGGYQLATLLISTLSRRPKTLSQKVLLSFAIACLVTFMAYEYLILQFAYKNSASFKFIPDIRRGPLTVAFYILSENILRIILIFASIILLRIVYSAGEYPMDKLLVVVGASSLYVLFKCAVVPVLLATSLRDTPIRSLVASMLEAGEALIISGLFLLSFVESRGCLAELAKAVTPENSSEEKLVKQVNRIAICTFLLLALNCTVRTFLMLVRMSPETSVMIVLSDACDIGEVVYYLFTFEALKRIIFIDWEEALREAAQEATKTTPFSCNIPKFFRFNLGKPAVTPKDEDSSSAALV